MHCSYFLSFLLPLSTLAHPQTSDTSQSSSQYTDDKQFRDKILSITNTYRKQHNATALSWNATLAKTAEEWSKGCDFKHSGGPTGENLSSGYPNASASVITWGQERKSYNFGKAEFSTATGHFTQLVWKSTTSVGCGRTECNGGQSGGKGNAPGWYVVCEYWPAGNMIGSFKENVQQQLKSSELPKDGASDADVPVDSGAMRLGDGKILALVVVGVVGVVLVL